jgi:hypothetical protein
VTASYRTRAPGRFWRLILWFVVLAVLIVVSFAVVPPGPLPTLVPVPVLSGFERAGRVSLARDCGYSVPLPASPSRSLWLFCDTLIYVRAKNATGDVSWTLTRFVPGSTAAAGPAVVGPGPLGREPGLLSEVGTPANAPAGTGAGSAPGGGPAQFLPQPAGLVTATGLPCGNGSYAASWISGAARVPGAPDLLITFDNYCVLSGSGGDLPEGFGLAEYDPATRTLSNDVNVFSVTGPGAGAGSRLLGSPVFSGRYLYLFGTACRARVHGGCTRGALLEARVRAKPLAWTDPLSYQWRRGGIRGSWTRDAAAATSVIARARPLAVSVADFAAAGRHFVLVEQTDITGSFVVYESPAPAGPWTRITSRRVPCRLGPGYLNFCRAIIAHPELSTPTQLVLSYFDPAVGARGHVMVAGFPW